VLVGRSNEAATHLRFERKNESALIDNNDLDLGITTAPSYKSTGSSCLMTHTRAQSCLCRFVAVFVYFAIVANVATASDNNDQSLLQFTPEMLEGLAENTDDLKVSPSQIAITVVYEPNSCSTSSSNVDMHQRVVDASHLVEMHPDILFAEIDASLVSNEWLDEQGITAFPALLVAAHPSVLLKKNYDTNDDDMKYSAITNSSSQVSKLVWIEYVGLHASARDIADTALQYCFRLVLWNTHGLFESGARWLRRPDQVMDHSDVLRSLLDETSSYHNSLLRYGVSRNQWSETEQNYIEWLLSSNKRGDFLLLVQCRRTSGPGKQDSYKVFDDFSRQVTNRRDYLFAILGTDYSGPCTGLKNDGAVFLFKTSLHNLMDETIRLDKLMQNQPSFVFQTRDENNAQDLYEFLLTICAPPVLWLDREMTAPIAFPLFRRVHLVLFIDMHDAPTSIENNMRYKEETHHKIAKQVISMFDHVCQSEKDAVRSGDLDRDLVCLIVPSADTRVLTTFGINIWESLDERFVQALTMKSTDTSSHGGVAPVPLLPIVMMTDQRHNGTVLYYLDREPILSKSDSISTFVSNFWDGSLVPRTKSETHESRINTAGVRILTANTLRELFNNQTSEQQYALVVFTSPTCGHCKRFSFIWNQLSELLNHVGWSQWIRLYQIDVTSNEIVNLNITVRWLPDVYYLRMGETELFRYDWKDKLGDGVGRLKDPIDILDWLFAETKTDNSLIQELLLDLIQKF
jgi:hypothetical protein